MHNSSEQGVSRSPKEKNTAIFKVHKNREEKERRETKGACESLQGGGKVLVSQWSSTEPSAESSKCLKHARWGQKPARWAAKHRGQPHRRTHRAQRTVGQGAD